MPFESLPKIAYARNFVADQVILPGISGKSYRLKSYMISCTNIVGSTVAGIYINGTNQQDGLFTAIAKIYMQPNLVNTLNQYAAMEIVTKAGTPVTIGALNDANANIDANGNSAHSSIALSYTEIDG